MRLADMETQELRSSVQVPPENDERMQPGSSSGSVCEEASEKGEEAASEKERAASAGHSGDGERATRSELGKQSLPVDAASAAQEDEEHELRQRQVAQVQGEQPVCLRKARTRSPSAQVMHRMLWQRSDLRRRRCARLSPMRSSLQLVA